MLSINLIIVPFTHVLYILGYEPIVSNGVPTTPTQAVMCFAGIVMLSFHGSFKLFESYNTLQSVISHRQLSSIRHPTSRSLLSSHGRLGYHVHIFHVSCSNNHMSCNMRRRTF